MPDQVPLSDNLASAAAQASEAQPEPADFKPRDNPAFILHGKLKTSFGEVSSWILVWLSRKVWTKLMNSAPCAERWTR